MEWQRSSPLVLLATKAAERRSLRRKQQEDLRQEGEYGEPWEQEDIQVAKVLAAGSVGKQGGTRAQTRASATESLRYGREGQEGRQ